MDWVALSMAEVTFACSQCIANSRICSLVRPCVRTRFRTPTASKCMCMYVCAYMHMCTQSSCCPGTPKGSCKGCSGKHYYVFFVGETSAQFLHREQLFVFLQKKVTIEGKGYSSVTPRPLISTTHSTWCQIRWLHDFSVQWPAVCVCSSGGGELLCVSYSLCSCHL